MDPLSLKFKASFEDFYFLKSRIKSRADDVRFAGEKFKLLKTFICSENVRVFVEAGLLSSNSMLSSVTSSL